MKKYSGSETSSESWHHKTMLISKEHSKKNYAGKEKNSPQTPFYSLNQLFSELLLLDHGNTPS